MNVGSVCTGVGGLDLGLERAGMRVLWQCEKDAYRRRVLARHWPGVPCFEDICGVRLDRGRCASARSGLDTSSLPLASDWSIDLLCGATPCQDLSVAGRRAGITGERSGLFFEFARIADELVRPGGWLVFENVPGLLSSNDGRDFAVVLATLANIGFHDLAYRVLDSRYFGVPQRRRRVFVVARRAVGRGACEVLLEPESGGGDFAPGREKGPRAAHSLGVGSKGASWKGDPYADNFVDHTLRSGGFDASEDGTGRGTPLVSANGAPSDSDRVRATPRLPRRVDDPQPDGPRYSACGDAVTVNVAQWIGERILQHQPKREESHGACSRPVA